MSAAADRNLLFGVLALQMDFINRDALIAAMQNWLGHKDKSLAEILQGFGQLSPVRLRILQELVEEHVAAHQGDVQQSLAAVRPPSGVKANLQALGDPMLDASLGNLVAAQDENGLSPTLRVPEANDGPAGGGPRYRILRPHAKGGVGEVFIAEDTELHREVALKEIQPSHADNADSRSRFLLEAEITGRLEHPNIVPVYGLGAYADGRPYFAMRFIRGDSLKDAIERFHHIKQQAANPKQAPATAPQSSSVNRSLEFRQLLGRFVDVCNAVSYAHSRGVLHRDLKPGNIMLGAYGETLVVDWGLAKAVGRSESQRTSPSGDERTLAPTSRSGSAATLDGSAIGTPAYMSPEQANGRLDLVGPTSDVFSLGATLYCLLTGTAPFVGANVHEILQNVRNGEFVPPREVLRTVPPPLDAVCRKALAHQPADRYATPSELAQEIENWLADEPVRAYAEPLAVRAGRWVRKHRTLVSSAAAVLVVATIGAIAASLVLAAKNTELANANAAEQAASAEALRNERRAQTEADIATAVKDFLKVDLLRMAAPVQQHREQARGALKSDPDLKVRDLVLRAAERIEGKFAGQPLVEAEIRWTLGWTLAQLGRDDLALPQRQRVREIYAAELGPEDPRTLMSVNNLASSLAAVGRAAEAIELHAEALRRQTAKLGPDHPETLMSRSNLAIAYAMDGQHQEAIKLDEATLQLRKDKLGPGHPDTIQSMNNLAVGYADAGRDQEALKLREETFQLSQATHGVDHPETLRSMDNLAGSYADVGRTQEALRLREDTLKLRKAKLGAMHINTLLSMHNLANSYAALGRTQDALKLREETLNLRKDRLGVDHADTLASMNSLANSYAAESRAPEALKLREATLQLHKDKLGADHPDTLTSMSNLAGSYAAAGRTPEALKLLQQALQLQTAKRGLDHPDTLRTTLGLADTFALAGRAQEGLKLYLPTLQLMKAKRGPDHPETLACMHNLANVYADLGQAQDALRLREETVQRRQARLGPDHPDTLMSMNSLATSYLEQRRLAEVMTLLPEIRKRRESRLAGSPASNIESAYLAVTDGQIGLARELGGEFDAALKSYLVSVQRFDELDKAGALKSTLFRVRMNYYRRRLALCRKAEPALRDLDFVLQQPAADVFGLLELRVRGLLKEHGKTSAANSSQAFLAAAVESAVKAKERATAAGELYEAACLFARCADAAKETKSALADGRGADQFADDAVQLLQRAVTKGFMNAAHLRQDPDLAILRDRADFQKLLTRIETAKH